MPAVSSLAGPPAQYGMVISGAGPTLLALTRSERVALVVASMLTSWTKAGVTADVRSLSLDTDGAKVVLS